MNILRRKVFSGNSDARAWDRGSYQDESKFQSLEGLGYQARCPVQEQGQSSQHRQLVNRMGPPHDLRGMLSDLLAAKTQEQTRPVTRGT